MIEIAYTIGVLFVVLCAGLFVVGVIQYLKIKVVADQHYAEVRRRIHRRRD